MAEMKGGQYVVNFTDKEGNVKEKAVSELSPDDIKQLAEASKPKSMEDLAKGQLDTLTRIQKILESQGRRLPSAIAASKGGKAVTEAPREIVEALETTTKGVTSKGLQQGLDKTTDIAFDVLNKFAQGTGTMADVSTAFSKISENTKTAFGESWSEAMKNGTTATQKLGESQNGIIQLLNTGIGTLKNSIAGTTSGNAVGSAPQKVKVKDFIIESLPEDKIIMAGGTNLDGSKSGGGRGNSEPTVIKLDFSVDVKGGNITEHQFMEVLNKTGIKESLTKTVTMELNRNSPESSPQKIMNNNFKK
jgi:hypothetical protein